MERSGTPSPRVKSPPSISPTSPLPRQNGVPVSKLSFAQQKAELLRPSKSNLVEGNNVMRSIDRPPPGDTVNRRKSQLQLGLAKKRSAYFENEFAAGRAMDPTKDRVRNEAIVMAELRTNVILQDEFTFITDLSYHLSNRYQRSMSSIVINVRHGCCMMFGGSFDPAYTLTIFALPTLVQPTMNKRNAALIQNHLSETLGVAPSRGYVRFVATAEEDVAIGGKTVAGEMDDLERGTKDSAASVSREHSKSSKYKKRLSTSSHLILRPTTAPPLESGILPTPPASMDATPMIATAIPEHPPIPRAKEPAPADKPAKVAGRKKSFVSALFSSKGSTKERRPKAAVEL
ncbi:Tautomerase/MIF superfamily [Xylariales sp. AK1849]|nr:Tautomerase/MIF superfamily [Xylariales sp. AK1849]